MDQVAPSINVSDTSLAKRVVAHWLEELPNVPVHDEPCQHLYSDRMWPAARHGQTLELVPVGDGPWLAGDPVVASDHYSAHKIEAEGLIQSSGLDRTILRIPVIGPIMTKSAIARYARTLATTFAAGVPLVEALDSVAGATGNIVYEKGVMKMRDEVATGQRLQRAMENTQLFPNMVIQMIAVGEESGSLDDMSGKVADFYEEEVDNAVDSMSSLLEPLIMAILGVLVGGLVIAMYLPIFKMGAVI